MRLTILSILVLDRLRYRHGTAKRLVGYRLQNVAAVIEQIAGAVFFEYSAEGPAMPVEIGKLGVSGFGVEVSQVGKKFRI